MIATPPKHQNDFERRFSPPRKRFSPRSSSTSDDKAVRLRLLAGGAAECLFKPFSETALLRRGRYLEIGLRSADASINPFAFERTAEHLQFLHAFVR